MANEDLVFDVFIAFHGDAITGTMGTANEVCRILNERGIKAYCTTYNNPNGNFSETPRIVQRTPFFLLVVNKNITVNAHRQIAERDNRGMEKYLYQEVAACRESQYYKKLPHGTGAKLLICDDYDPYVASQLDPIFNGTEAFFLNDNYIERIIQWIRCYLPQAVNNFVGNDRPLTTNVDSYTLNADEFLILKNMVQLHNNEIKNACSEFNLTEDFFNNAYSINGGEIIEDNSVINAIHVNEHFNNIVIIGSAGVGKSFALKKSFIFAANDFIVNDSILPIPIYCKFSDFSNGDVFDGKRWIRKYYQLVCNRQIDEDLLNKYANIHFLVFCDSLDEWKYAFEDEKIKNLLNSFDRYVIAMQEICYKRIVGLLDNVFLVKLYGWNYEVLHSYVLNCLGNVGDELFNSNVEIILKKLCNNSGLKISNNYCNVLYSKEYYSPILVAITLKYIIEENCVNIRNPLSTLNIAEIFKVAVRGTIKRAYKQQTEDFEEHFKDLINLYEEVSWFIYHNGINEKRVIINYLMSNKEIKSKFYNETIITKELLHFYIESNDKIYPYHQFFLSYFIAERTIKLLNSNNLDEIFKKGLASDSNRMLSYLFSDPAISKNLEMYFSNLRRYLKKQRSDDMRTKVLYFIFRLFGKKDAKLDEDIIHLLKSYLDNKNTSYNIAIYNSLTQLGDMKLENEYYCKLISNNELFIKRQLDTYLIYQNDRNGLFGEDLLENENWGATANSYLEHFESPEMRHKFIRRIDLVTMCLFIKSGKSLGRGYEEFVSYFNTLSLDKLFDITFNEKFIKVLTNYKININDRKESFKDCLNLLQNEINLYKNGC